MAIGIMADEDEMDTEHLEMVLYNYSSGECVMVRALDWVEDDTALPSLKEVEDEMIRRALRATGGNKTRAAKVLGIGSWKLRYKANEEGR